MHIKHIQILDALNDPKRNEEMVKELMDNVHTIEDENGNKHKLFSLGGLFLDANKFCKQSTSMRNTKNFSLRDDDIILAACPKTGIVIYYVTYVVPPTVTHICFISILLR